MVGLAVEAVGWDDGGCGGVIAGAEGEAESGAEQGAGGGGLAAVSVNDPLAGSRAVAAHGGKEEVVGVHGMDDEWLAEACGKACMEVEDGLLGWDVAASQAVEAALADGYRSWIAGSRHKGAQGVEADGTVGVPGVYTHAVCAAGLHGVAGAYAHDGCARAGERSVVGVDVGVSVEGASHGTGS